MKSAINIAFFFLLLIGSALTLISCGRSQIPSVTTAVYSSEEPQIVKILVPNTGIYRLDSKTLRQADVRGVLDGSTRVSLFNRGNEQPLWVEGTGEDYRLTFIGRASDSEYSKENVYWLVFGEKDGWEIFGEKSS